MQLFSRNLRCRFHRLLDVSGLSEENQMVQQTALDFANQTIRPFALDWDRSAHFPREVFKQAAELGFGALFVREANGGSGVSRLDGALVFEALATGCVSTSAYLSIHNMTLAMLDKYGSEWQIAELLPELISMDQLTSYCLTEPQSGSDAANMQTKARLEGEEWVIDGQKVFISGGGQSDWYFVMCLTGEKERSCILVPKSNPNISFGNPEHKMGWRNSPTTVVTFDSVRVPQRFLLGERGKGFHMAMAALDGGRVNISATSLGAAADSYARTMDYVADRRQFGQKLVDFQSIGFSLAQMATRLSASRMMLYAAANKLDQNDPEKNVHAAMAKLFVTEESFQIVDQCLQLHGGYGYLEDYGVEKHLRDIRVNRILEGTNEVMQLVISRRIKKLCQQ